MATVYKIKVICASPFCAFSDKEIHGYIKESLQKFNHNGSRLESIVVSKSESSEDVIAKYVRSLTVKDLIKILLQKILD